MLTSARPIRPSPMQMTSLVYHELSTPLAIALWYIGIADTHCKQESDAAAHHALVVARGQVEALRDLVERVLDLEKHGRPRMRPTASNLGELVGAIVDRVTAARGSEAPVSVHVRGSLNGHWDGSVVDQIVGNLLSNAMKFSDNKPVDIRVIAGDGGAWIIVRDQGPGIPAQDHKRIFERYVCAPRSAGGGLGLGLWLVRRLAEAHGGRVTVRSRPGQGTTFRVYLQRHQAIPELLATEPPPVRGFVRARAANGQFTDLRAPASLDHTGPTERIRLRHGRP